MTRPTGVCERRVCGRPVFGHRRFCSQLCEDAGPGLRSGSEGQTGKPSCGGDRDLSVLSGVIGVGADEAVYIRQGEPKPPDDAGPDESGPDDESGLDENQCRECRGQVSEARMRLLLSRRSTITCGSPCAQSRWRRMARRRAKEKQKAKAGAGAAR